MGGLGVGVIGAGYWGPNLIRNLSASDAVDLRWVCDLDEARARKALGRYSTVHTTASIDDVLDDPLVAAVAIATPAATHTELGLAAIDAGKHVLIEKPLAPSFEEGRKLVTAAEHRGMVLMCDHTYCYTPTVGRIAALVHGGELGEIQYIDSVRINLGLVQRDVDVIWDLAPHDLSILDFVLPEDSRPIAVSATGADPVGAGHACVAYLSMPLSSGGIAGVHVNWLSPTKVRRTIVAGSKKMLVWDDLSPQHRLMAYDKGVELTDGGPDERRISQVAYRVGDAAAPALPEREALAGVIEEFVAAITEHREPLTSGSSGLRVLALLEAASASLERAGALVAIPGAAP